MNHPSDTAERRQIESWIKSQSDNDGFKAFLRWIESERDERDRENRVPGKANATSEAQALTTILEVTMFGADGERIRAMRDASSR